MVTIGRCGVHTPDVLHVVPAEVLLELEEEPLGGLDSDDPAGHSNAPRRQERVVTNIGSNVDEDVARLQPVRYATRHRRLPESEVVDVLLEDLARRAGHASTEARPGDEVVPVPRQTRADDEIPQ